MKVLLIDVNCKNSSTGKIVYDLYSYINSIGDEAAVCYGRGDKVNEKNIYKFGLDWETYVHAFLTRLTGFTGCFSYLSTKRLLRFIKKFQPDVVHIHELHAYFVNIKPLINYLKTNHIKTVMTLHCEFAYTGKCGHSVECEQWKNGCQKCPHLKEYVSTMWFDHTGYMWKQKKELFEDFDKLTVVTPSKWLADRAKESILKDNSIHVIHNGVDTSSFYPKDTSALRKTLGIDYGEKVVFALAPHLMSEAKGGTYLLQMAKKFEKQKVKFVMVGIDAEYQIDSDSTITKRSFSDRKKTIEYYSGTDTFFICNHGESIQTKGLGGVRVNDFDTEGMKNNCLHIIDKSTNRKEKSVLDDSDSLSVDKDRDLEFETTQHPMTSVVQKYDVIYKQSGCYEVLDNIICFAPIYDCEILSQMYSLADVYITCSKKETFSMTCAEALCCGTPVVGFRCGAPETIFEEPYAHFIEYGNIDALEDQLEAVLNHQNDRCGIAGWASGMFSNSRMLKEYMKLY